MSSSDIAIADQGIRRAFEEDVARSQSAADPALRFALVSWEGTALQEFNGVHALVTKYVRTNYPHSANMHIQRINIQDGPHSFSMFLSMRADRLATLQPVIDDIVVSLTRAASSPAAPVPPTAPARDVVSEGLKSPATDAFGLSAWLLVWAAVLVVFAAVYLIKNQ